MKKWFKRSLSFFLAMVMVIGLMPANLTVHAAYEKDEQYIKNADGVIWVTTKPGGGDVSDTFMSMLTSLELDDMVREALGITDSSVGVYFSGVNIGDATDIAKNVLTGNNVLDSIEADMRAAVSEQYPVQFFIGGKDEASGGIARDIAFRNLHAMKVDVDGTNKIVISKDRAPSSVTELDQWLDAAFADARVSVTYGEDDSVTALGIHNENLAWGSDNRNMARYTDSGLLIDKNLTKEALLKKWPDIATSPSSPVYKVGTVKVAIYAAEYRVSQKDDFKNELDVEVYFEDLTERAKITIKAEHAFLAEGSTADPTISNYVYSEYIPAGTVDLTGYQPKIANYSFDGWKGIEGNTVDLSKGEHELTAIMRPLVDINGNGLADQNEKFEVTYQNASGNVIATFIQLCGQSTMLPGEEENFTGLPAGYKWAAVDGGAWQPFVYKSVVYHPVQIGNGGTVETKYVTAHLLSGGAEVDSSQLPAKMINSGGTATDGTVIAPTYVLEDPNWNTYVPKNSAYKSTEFYTKTKVNDKQKEATEDLDGNPNTTEYTFVVHNDTNCPGTTCNCTQFTEMPEVYFDVYKVNKYGVATGTADNPIEIYEFETAAGIVRHEYDAYILSEENVEPIDLAPAYGAVAADEIFLGWEYGDITSKGNINYYSIEPQIAVIDNKIEVASENIKTAFEAMGYKLSGPTFEDGKIVYTWVSASDATYYYQMEVEITGAEEIDLVDGTKKIAYLYEENTEVAVSPIWKVNRNDNTKRMYGYVDGLSWVYDSVASTRQGKEITVRYDANNYAYNDAALGTNKFEGQSGTEAKNISLYVHSQFVQLDTNTYEFAAGQSYDSDDILANVITSNVESNKDLFTIEYLARQEGSVTVSLYRLKELFESEGLGFLFDEAIELLGGNDYTITLDEKWVSIDKQPKEEMTAQEATDAYLEELFRDHKEDFVNVGEFALEFYDGIRKELEENVMHKFAYVAPGVSDSTEALRITCKSDRISISADQVVTVKEYRPVPEFTIKSAEVTEVYGNEVTNAVLQNVALTAGDVALYPVSVDAEGNYSVRNYADAKSDKYTNSVAVLFKGNAEFAPVVSDTFTLTITKVQPEIKVTQLIATEKGKADYYDKAHATVDPKYTPIVQIVAGVSEESLKVGADFSFANDTLVVDAWVKLPQELTDMLDGFDLGVLGIEGIPEGKIQIGHVYTVEDLMAAIDEYLGNGDAEGSEELSVFQTVLDYIPDVIEERLGLAEMKYALRVRVDALGKDVYPTEPGFYVNYAATLSKITAQFMGYEDPNYGVADATGFIVISPIIPVPNRGGVQLYDPNSGLAENVFVYEYNGEEITRDLKVSYKDDKEILGDAVPFYYGLNTRFDATSYAPSKPGVYFVGYRYTTEIYNEDAKENEGRLLGSDSALIIIKQREVDLDVQGGKYKVEEGENKTAKIVVTDKNGKVVEDAGVTVVSATVNANQDGNVSFGDIYGTMNIDFPDGFDALWDAYFEEQFDRQGPNEIRPSDLIKFLETCEEKAADFANGKIDAFQYYMLNDVIRAELAKINVSSDNLANEAEKVQSLMKGAEAYFAELLKHLEPLRSIDDNIFLTFYDLDDKALGYDQTGYYLYLGITTDPDVTVASGTALVTIYTDDDYLMNDTYVPYDAKPHNIDIDDTTPRGDVTMMADRAKNEVKFFLDGDVFKAVNQALEAVLGKGELIKDGSDVVYKKSAQQKIAGKVTDAIMAEIEAKLPVDIPEPELTRKAIRKLTNRILTDINNIDSIPNDLTIYVYEKKNATDLKGMPVDAGTYQFYGYDYDVAATRGTLIIEPIYIVIDDVNVEKTYGDETPDEELYSVEYEYYSKKTLEDGSIDAEYQVSLPNGVFVEDLVDCTVSRTPGEDVGVYDMIVNATLKDTSGNYVLAPHVEDGQDFVIVPKDITVQAVVNGETALEIYAGTEVALDSIIYDAEKLVITLDSNIVKGFEIKDTDGKEVELAYAIANAGTYTITPVVDETNENYNNYNVSLGEATLVVGPKEITLTATVNGDSALEIYAGDAVTVSITVTDTEGNPIETPIDTDYVIDSTLAWEDAIKTPGTYTITPVLKDVSGNYKVDTVKPATLTVKAVEVEPKTIKLQANVSKNSIVVDGDVELTTVIKDSNDNVLQDLDLEIEYKITNAKGDSFTWDNAKKTVGLYTITPVLVGENKDNYTVSETLSARLAVVEGDNPIPKMTVIITIANDNVAKDSDVADVGLDVTFKDNLGSDPDQLMDSYFNSFDIKTNGYSLEDLNGNGSVLDEALANAGKYHIGAIIKGNPEQIYAMVNTNTVELTVFEDNPIPSMTVTVLPQPIYVVKGTLTASDIDLEVIFKDNLGTDAEQLKNRYFDYFDIKADGYSLEDENGNGSALDEALAEAGTYRIDPIMKGNPENTYSNVVVDSAELYVIDPDNPEDPENPGEPAKPIISIWVSTNHSSFVVGNVTSDEVEAYINPQLKVTLTGTPLSDDWMSQLKPSYKLVDSNGNEVQLKDIVNKVGTYQYVVDCEDLFGYHIYKTNKTITVEAKQLTAIATIFRNAIEVDEVPVLTDASDYTIKVVLSDNVDGTDLSSDLKYQFISTNKEERYVITDANGVVVTLDEALKKVGTYKITPVVDEAKVEAVYGTQPILRSAYLTVSLREVDINAVVLYTNANAGVSNKPYVDSEIAWKHPAVLGTSYEITAHSFWENETGAAQELAALEAILKPVTKVYDAKGNLIDLETTNILETLGSYSFVPEGDETQLDKSVYKVNWLDTELNVVQIGAQARIRPKTDSKIFKAVEGEEKTYKMVANYTAEQILADLNLSVEDDHGNAGDDSLVIKLTVTKQDSVSLARKMVRVTSDNMLELAQLAEPGKYTIEMTVEDPEGIYSRITKDSIEVIVEERTYSIALGKATLSLEGEVYIEYMPALSGFDGMDLTGKGGLLIWTNKEADPSSVEDLYIGSKQCDIVENMYWSEKFERWTLTTTGISAKEYGDTMWMRPYIKVDGEIIYGEGAKYSPKRYCEQTFVDPKASDNLKTVCAALLNYGAAAQVYFNYKYENKEENLINYGFDLSGYDLKYDDKSVKEILDPLKRPSKEPYYGDNVVKDYVGGAKVTLSLDSAIVAEVVYPGVTLDMKQIEDAQVLVWTEEEFNAEGEFGFYAKSTLRAKLELGSLMGIDGYVATLKQEDPSSRYAGIPLKECGDTIYFIAYFKMKDGSVYCSPLNWYSPDRYVEQTIDDVKSSENLKNVSKALAVVSDKARINFNYKMD